MAPYRCIIVDLDGTLCNHDHRKHLFGGDFNAYHAALADDTIHDDIFDIVATLSSAGYSILACTGRPERYRDATIAHFRATGIDSYIDELLMRPDSNFDSDAVVKLALVDEHFSGREIALGSVGFILDDRDKVVEAFRDAGFRVLQVANGDY